MMNLALLWPKTWVIEAYVGSVGRQQLHNLALVSITLDESLVDSLSTFNLSEFWVTILYWHT